MYENVKDMMQRCLAKGFSLLSLLKHSIMADYYRITVVFVFSFNKAACFCLLPFVKDSGMT